MRLIHRPELQFLSYPSLPSGSNDCDRVIGGPNGGPDGSSLGVPYAALDGGGGREIGGAGGKPGRYPDIGGDCVCRLMNDGW